MIPRSSFARTLQHASQRSCGLRLPRLIPQPRSLCLPVANATAAPATTFSFTVPQSRPFSTTDDSNSSISTTSSATATATTTATDVDTSTLLDAFRDPLSRQDRTEQKVGRPWSVRELRRKSFDDLHKLWYVLYMERNMLMTEQVLSRRNQIAMIQPERLGKVQKSFGAIRQVLGERKRERISNKLAELAERRMNDREVFDGDTDEISMADFDDEGAEEDEKEEEEESVEKESQKV